MRGQILEFNVQLNSGTISADDGNRYSFTGAEWKAAGAPITGTQVDFVVEDGQAKGVFAVSAGSSKSKVAAGLLAIFLGGFGVHKFYLGFTGPGLVYLLVNTVGWAITWALLGIPNLILGIMAFVEGIIYLTKSDQEFEQTYVVGKKQWF